MTFCTDRKCQSNLVRFLDNFYPSFVEIIVSTRSHREGLLSSLIHGTRTWVNEYAYWLDCMASCNQTAAFLMQHRHMKSKNM